MQDAQEANHLKWVEQNKAKDRTEMDQAELLKDQQTNARMDAEEQAEAEQATAEQVVYEEQVEAQQGCQETSSESASAESAQVEATKAIDEGVEHSPVVREALEKNPAAVADAKALKAAEDANPAKEAASTTPKHSATPTPTY